LKLNCDEPLSNFAFSVNLRRYTPGVCPGCLRHFRLHFSASLFGFPFGACVSALGGAVQVNPIYSPLKAPETKRLKLQYDELLSSCPLKSNFRRYGWAPCGTPPAFAAPPAAT